jgi:nephrocystin-3
MCKYERTIGYYEKALSILTTALGDKHPHVAIIYNNIGTACDSLGQHERAIEYHEKALPIFTDTLGEAQRHTKRKKKS